MKTKFELNEWADMIGAAVNVESVSGDDFHDFTGTVKSADEYYVIVEDQGGDCFYVWANQLTLNSDEWAN